MCVHRERKNNSHEIQRQLDTPVFWLSSSRILWSQKFGQSDFYAFQLSTEKVSCD